jgi:hypothetical protein
MIKTIISSAKQDAIEPFKPSFMFGFVDAPQFVATECRGKIAHMIKCYRKQPNMYQIKRIGLHDYEVKRGRTIARIWAQ